MTNELLYERVRAKFNEGYGQNPFAPLLKNSEVVLRPMEGRPEQFAQIAYELTRGKLNEISEDVAYVTRGIRDP